MQTKHVAPQAWFTQLQQIVPLVNNVQLMALKQILIQDTTRPKELPSSLYALSEPTKLLQNKVRARLVPKENIVSQHLTP